MHLLVALHPSCSIAEVVKNLKGISHIWVRDNQLSDQYFHWQDGYAAISVSPGRVSIVRNYIRNQERRHSRQSFKKEWAELRKHAIEIRNDGFKPVVTENGTGFKPVVTEKTRRYGEWKYLTS